MCYAKCVAIKSYGYITMSTTVFLLTVTVTVTEYLSTTAFTDTVFLINAEGVAFPLFHLFVISEVSYSFVL